MRFTNPYTPLARKRDEEMSERARKAHEAENAMSELVITEGVSGMWHYHVSKKDAFIRGLCGAPTMQTAMRIDSWKVPFGEHFPKRPTWCAKCDALKEGAK